MPPIGNDYPSGVAPSNVNSALGISSNSASSGSTVQPGAPTTTAEQLKLSPSPEDGVTAVKFQPGRGAQFLVVSGWDCFVRLYDCSAGGQRACYQHTSPVLTACFTDAGHTISGSAVGDMRLFDINAGASSHLGKCDRAISAIHYSETIQAVITGSWDRTVRIWDPRAIGHANRSLPPGAASAQMMAQVTQSIAAQGTHQQPASVYTLDTVRHNLVVGTAQRHVLIWDLRQMGQAVEQRESNLRFQTRCIRCFPNGQGYVLSSIEGRVAVEMFDPSPEVQKKKYAFKCHRLKEGDKELIHPVTAIAFHQGYNTFATGGCDGFVNIWDGFNRKRLAQLHRLHTSIASLDFSDDGTQLAIAAAYMWENGPLENQPESALFVRSILDHEVKPKHIGSQPAQSTVSQTNSQLQPACPSLQQHNPTTTTSQMPCALVSGERRSNWP